MDASIISGFIGTIIIIVIFLLIREFWCWYFKFSEISDKLSILIKLQGGTEKKE
jgi:hypothetical protein